MRSEVARARREVIVAALDFARTDYELSGALFLADQVLADAVKQYANFLNEDANRDSHPLKNRDLGFTELIELKDGATVRDRFGVVWTLKRSGLGTRFYSSVEPVVGVLAGDLERAAKPIKLVSSPTV